MRCVYFLDECMVSPPERILGVVIYIAFIDISYYTDFVVYTPMLLTYSLLTYYNLTYRNLTLLHQPNLTLSDIA